MQDQQENNPVTIAFEKCRTVDPVKTVQSWTKNITQNRKMQEPGAYIKKEIADCRDGKPTAMKKENVERQGRSSGIFYAGGQSVSVAFHCQRAGLVCRFGWLWRENARWMMMMTGDERALPVF